MFCGFFFVSLQGQLFFVQMLCLCQFFIVFCVLELEQFLFGYLLQCLVFLQNMCGLIGILFGIMWWWISRQFVIVVRLKLVYVFFWFWLSIGMWYFRQLDSGMCVGILISEGMYIRLWKFIVLGFVLSCCFIGVVVFLFFVFVVVMLFFLCDWEGDFWNWVGFGYYLFCGVLVKMENVYYFVELCCLFVQVFGGG